MGAELWGVMPTFRRPETLAETLGALAEQTRVLDHLVVVDNGGDVDPDLESSALGRRAARHVTLLRPGDNLGPAGAFSTGLDHVLRHATADAWVACLDDDDPPLFPDTLECLWTRAHQLVATDPRCGALGVGGAHFDAARVRLSRMHNDELTGQPMRVSVLSGNRLPMLRLAAVREVGAYNADLFFGFEECEFFLRMNTRGWHVYCDTELLRRYRAARGRTGEPSVPSRRLGPANWRRYYSIRNRVYIARRFAGRVPAARLVAELMGKVLANLGSDPRGALQHLRLTTRACGAGLMGRLGRTWPPELTHEGRLPSYDRRRARSLGGEP